MIEILGKKRILMLTLLVALNAVLGAALYMYFMPETKKVSRTLASTKSKIGSVQSDLSQAQSSMADLADQEDLFFFIRDDVLFFKHDRQQISNYLLGLKDQYERANIETNVSIESLKTSRNNEAAKAGYVIAESPIKVTMSALDDVSIMSFLSQIKTTFPGYLKLESFKMSKNGKVNEDILKKVGLGENPELVEAEMLFSWYSMIKNPDEEEG